jgi:transglutaminase-like putative cysteine protease
MRIAIRHSIGIGLGSGAAHGVQHLLLTAQTGPTQTVLDWRIEMPGFATAQSFIDAYGNRAQLVSQSRPEGDLTITVAGLVETVDRNGVVGRPPGEPVPALFRRITPGTKAIGAIAGKFRTAQRDGGERIALYHQVMARVGEVMSSAQGQSQNGQSQTQGVAAPASAQAEAFIGAVRSLGLPARYVRGYLAGAGGEAANHAWAEAWDEGLGWIGFDPTLQLCPTDRHVRVAIGLDAASAAPVRSIPASGTPRSLDLVVEAAQ